MGTAPQTGRIDTLPAARALEAPPKIAVRTSARQRSAGSLDFMALLSCYRFKVRKLSDRTRSAERKTTLCLRLAKLEDADERDAGEDEREAGEAARRRGVFLEA